MPTTTCMILIRSAVNVGQVTIGQQHPYIAYEPLSSRRGTRRGARRFPPSCRGLEEQGKAPDSILSGIAMQYSKNTSATFVWLAS